MHWGSELYWGSESHLLLRCERAETSPNALPSPKLPSPYRLRPSRATPPRIASAPLTPPAFPAAPSKAARNLRPFNP